MYGYFIIDKNIQIYFKSLYTPYPNAHNLFISVQRIPDKGNYHNDNRVDTMGQIRLSALPNNLSLVLDLGFAMLKSCFKPSKCNVSWKDNTYSYQKYPDYHPSEFDHKNNTNHSKKCDRARHL